MDADFSNVYDDETRADAYATLEFPGTYYLAYRDLPAIFAEHVAGPKALDFGCGTGRSTRFLAAQGFEPVVGVDIAARMIDQARRRDPTGDYRLLADGDLDELAVGDFDLVFSSFTFDNIPAEEKLALLQSLQRMLNDAGRLVILGSTPEIYRHEWASFSTKDFPENPIAKSGDTVRTRMLDVEDARPVMDILCTDEDYRELYAHAGLRVIRTERPLAKPDEPYAWVSETEVPPWVIYVLGREH